MGILENITNYFIDQVPEAASHEPVETAFKRSVDASFVYLQHEVQIHYGPEMIAEPPVDPTQAGIGAAATQTNYELAG